MKVLFHLVIMKSNIPNLLCCLQEMREKISNLQSTYLFNNNDENNDDRYTIELKKEKQEDKNKYKCKLKLLIKIRQTERTQT